MTTNEQKQLLWQAYRDRKPTRVPVTYGVNPRVVLLDPKWNTKGISFAEYFSDPKATVEIQLRFMEYQSQFLNHYCDSPVGRPDRWAFHVDNQNIYDSAYFGAPLAFRDGQVPDVYPYLSGRDKNRIFEIDIEQPLSNPFVKDCLRRYEALRSEVARLRYGGMAFTVNPPLMGFDGPFTIAINLRSDDLLVDLYDDPGYVRRLMEFVQRGVAIRNRALAGLFKREAFEGPRGSLADDSIQLISTDTYRRMVMPLHRSWYAQWSPGGPHSMHLCGDATRHFPTIHEELSVDSFDTGFPVDHGGLRRALGPDVEILGGPEVSLLLNGTPRQVYERTRQILGSGVMRGGRFVLREANNLPPGCPEANLAAMYQCCLDHGNYPAGGTPT